MLSLLPERPADPQTDWLIDAAPYKADVYRTDKPQEIALDNGLLRRTFRLAPNGATVGLENLTTNETLLRGVKPEAVVTIDGVRYEVGGLRGQPNYAYLLPEWLDDMTANADAMQLVGYEVGKPTERMAWKRVRHHAPDVSWPPKGVYLRMDYAMPQPSKERIQQLAAGYLFAERAQVGDDLIAPAAPASDFGRTRLLSDDFAVLDPAWTIHLSKAHPRCSFENEGKVGEILAPANVAVYAERTLPAGTRQVEATIDCGTDQGASWGPGIALVFGERTVHFYLRPSGGAEIGKPRFGGSNGGQAYDWIDERLSLDISEPWSLRLRVVGESIACDARRAGQPWRTYHVFRSQEPWGEPTAVRLGKMDPVGGGSDYPQPGELGRLRIIDFAAHSDLSDAALASVRDKFQRRDIRVSVHYELYDGIPALSKWITVQNNTNATITVDRFASEVLAVVEDGSWVETRDGVPLSTPRKLHVETDFAFASFDHLQANHHVVHWRTDPQYSTQVNYLRQTPCLLMVEPTYGPAQDIEPGKQFESCRAFELIHDSTDRGRQGLALKRMYRTISPWVTENPIMHHMRIAQPDAVRQAIDQAADVGFEMIVMSFGSGFDMDNEDGDYLKSWKQVADYAKSKEIELGSYSLLSSRGAPEGNMIVSPPGMRPKHGQCPALASEWGQAYFQRLRDFYQTTGFSLLEHDGSYPGDVDVTPRPPLQKGIDDSRWVQWRIISDFYKWCRAEGIYLNVPDYYYLSGSNKCGMGYREVNWSLPRAMQVIHTRQNIYDGTWARTPSMGWMFVPLSQYHGGGEAATIEPLDAHRDHYDRMLASNFALGVQACYRGPRIYDTDRTRALVKQHVDWFKRYRDILESDMVHGRRADGRDLDWMLHVNPQLEQKGMLVVFNPLDRAVDKPLRVNLYYTGLTKTARLRHEDGEPADVELDRDYHVTVPVTVPAGGWTWYVIE